MLPPVTPLANVKSTLVAGKGRDTTLVTLPLVAPLPIYLNPSEYPG
jgi:hypothetical protein